VTVFSITITKTVSLYFRPKVVLIQEKLYPLVLLISWDICKINLSDLIRPDPSDLIRPDLSDLTVLANIPIVTESILPIDRSSLPINRN